MYTSSANSGFSLPGLPWDSGWATDSSSRRIGGAAPSFPRLLPAYTPQYLANVCASFRSRSACWAASELEHPVPSASQPRQRAWQPNSVNTTLIEQRRWSHPAPKLVPQLVRDLSTDAIFFLLSENTLQRRNSSAHRPYGTAF